MNSIWCLFSIDNDYNQPSNNLVVWWSKKPTIDCLKDLGFGEQSSNLLDGQEIRHGYADFRLREVTEKQVLD